MKIMLRAAIAALSFASIGSAYAGEIEGIQANTLCTQLPGVIAQAPVQNVPAIAAARNGQVVRAYVTNADRGTWLFQGNQGHEGANS